MSYRSWASKLSRVLFTSGAKRARQQVRCQPCLESLEDRVVPSVTPLHLYELNGTLTDAMGGPALHADGGTLTSTRYVFDPNQGLTLTGGLTDTSNYSVAFETNLSSVGSFYKKMIDFQARTSDDG